MGKGSSGSTRAPDTPTSGENYASWIQAYNQYAPERQQTELGDLATQMEIARRAAPELMALEQQYAPQYNQMQYDIEAQMAPQYYALQQAQRERQVADIAALSPSLRTAMSDPQTEAIRQQLGNAVQEQLSYGANLDPSLAREVEQGVRAGQSARGMIRGNAPVSQEALMKGIQAEQLRQNRQNAASQFLQTQAATQFDPWTALTGINPTRQATGYQAPSGQFAGFSDTFNNMMDMTNQNSQLQSQLSYNAQQANNANSGGMFGNNTTARIAAAPFTAGLSLFL